MKCKKCKSENLQVVKSGPHNKLVCIDCLAFQKFLSASELKIFKELQATNKPLQADGEGQCVKIDLGRPPLMEYYQYPEGKPRRP